MMYQIVFAGKTKKVLDKWKKSNPALFKKTSDILRELVLHPKTGTGHPEPLVNGDGTKYSRRLSANDRIIYSINDEIVTVYVLSLGGHYDDK